MSTFGRRCACACIVAAFAAAPAPTAHAFAEDVCYSQEGVPAHNCGPLPPPCPTDIPTAPACGLQAFLAYGYTLRQPLGGRSLVHADATYLLARTAGFPERDAYWIAAYDEATDLGTFTPRDVDGRPVPGADTLTTRDIGGLVRTHFATGGFLFHFPPTLGPSTPQEGLRPDVTDPRHEVMLAHLRRWAMAGPGGDAPLCTGGFTTASAAGDLGTGPACYADPSPVPIDGEYSVVAPVAVPFTNATGEQVVSGDVRSDRFDSWIGDQAANARIGIYLHALADRISHHACVDAGTTVPPTPEQPAFRVELNTPSCDQGPHALRHEYETGEDFDSLTPGDRTTEAALAMVYDELLAFARARGVLDAHAGSPEARTAVLDRGLVPALEIRDPLARMAAVSEVGCRSGAAPFPGAPVCAE
ncbi:hypothetical protein ACWF62_04310 [Rhodococcus sp. NPDC054953]